MTSPRSEPVEVLWLVKGLGAGGAEHLLASLATAHDAAVVHFRAAYALSWKTQLVAALEEQGVAVHALGVRTLADPRWIWRLRRLMSAGDVDVVHGHSPAVMAVARIVNRTIPRARRPLTVSTEHNLWASHGRVTRMANRVTYRLDAAHVAVARPIVAGLPRRAAAATEVVTHGPDPVRLAEAQVSERAAVRAALGVAPGALVAVTVANLRATKGHDVLVDAVRRVSQRGLDMTFLVVGQGPLESDLRRAAADLPALHVVGHQPNAPSIIAASDLFVLASRHEGLPIALLEAMALGTPVVATRVGGIPDVVRDGVDGLLVAPGDPDALARAIERLATDPTERARLADAARLRAADFDIRHAARCLERIYATITPPRSPTAIAG